MIKPFVLAMALLSPIPADPPVCGPPAPIIAQTVGAVALIPVAARDEPTLIERLKAAVQAIKDDISAREQLIAQLLLENSTKKQELAKALAELGVTPPPPGPGPGPSPLSAGAAKIRDLVLATVPDYAGRAATAAKLAQVYATASSRVSQAAALNPPPAELQPYTTGTGIMKAVGEASSAAFSGDRTRWDAFYKGYVAYVQGLIASGTLKGAATFPAFLDDVAAGLGAVK